MKGSSCLENFMGKMFLSSHVHNKCVIVLVTVVWCVVCMNYDEWIDAIRAKDQEVLLLEIRILLWLLKCNFEHLYFL